MAGRQFKLGLVVGKFSPLHLGHEWLISQAALRCERLLILSYSNPEYARCAAGERRRWLKARFPEHESIVIDALWLLQQCQDLPCDPRPIPGNHSSEEQQQGFLAWLLREVLDRAPDAIFCSEPYGGSCAMTLTKALGYPIEAMIMDLDRKHVPVSATQIRQSPHEHGRWMAPEVASAFVRRIALLGGESTGKSTLAAALAIHYKTLWVHEYGRELWELQKGVMSESDLLKIGYEQIHREEAALRSSKKYLFCDTSPLTTAGYSLWMFGHIDPQLQALAARTYDALILCRPDFAFVQDGFRREEAFRDEQHVWYQKKIESLACPILEVGGSVEQRISSVVSWLATLEFT